MSVTGMLRRPTVGPLIQSCDQRKLSSDSVCSVLPEHVTNRAELLKESGSARPSFSRARDFPNHAAAVGAARKSCIASVKRRAIKIAARVEDDWTHRLGTFTEAKIVKVVRYASLIAIRRHLEDRPRHNRRCPRNTLHTGSRLGPG